MIAASLAVGDGRRAEAVDMTRHLLDVTDFTADEVRQILTLAEAPIDSLGRPLAGPGRR